MPITSGKVSIEVNTFIMETDPQHNILQTSKKAKNSLTFLLVNANISHISLLFIFLKEYLFDHAFTWWQFCNIIFYRENR